MSSTVENSTSKYRTTFYLTEENKAMLDQIPRGMKTELVNEALSLLLKKRKKEQNNKKLNEMIQAINPVQTQSSSEEMVKALRDNKQAGL